MIGVLLAAHAMVAVAVLHQALDAIAHPLAGSNGFTDRRRAVHAGNQQALATLRQHARPTPTGARVIAALDDVQRALSDG